jgi:hypothetical protein
MITDKKDETDYDKDILHYFELFDLPNIKCELKGSAQYKYLKL